MRIRLTALLVSVLVLAAGTAAWAADSTPAATPELAAETFAGASAIVGRPLPKGVELPKLQSVFRPWTIADNRVRGVKIKTDHETFDGQYEHVLLQGDKVVAVRLFVMNMERIKQMTPELEHLYIKDFAEELRSDYKPWDKAQATVPDIFAVETPDMDKWTPRQWSYTAQNKLVYTVCWAPAAYVQVWIETPKFHTARLAEEARNDDAHPVSY